MSKVAFLVNAFAQRNNGDFLFGLEFLKCDPNLSDESSELSMFETILKTPESPDFIKLCITHGADLYKVYSYSI
jgi:hypothetical protein